MIPEETAEGARETSDARIAHQHRYHACDARTILVVVLVTLVMVPFLYELRSNHSNFGRVLPHNFQILHPLGPFFLLKNE